MMTYCSQFLLYISAMLNLLLMQPTVQSPSAAEHTTVMHIK